MSKYTKSFPIVKERSCTCSIVLDTRTNRKGVTEYPLAIRFTVNRKIFYYPVGGAYSEKRFSDICNASKSHSENYRIQKEWRETVVPKYKNLLEGLNKGGLLTFEMVKQAVLFGKGHEVEPTSGHSEKKTFIGIWEQVIEELRTNDGGARFTTAERYVYALRSLKRILGENAITGFNISAAEIQKWKDGMHNGVKGADGELVGKISDTTAGIYLRCCRAIWNRCVRKGYLQDVPYPFSNKIEKGLVSIPKSAKRRQYFLKGAETEEQRRKCTSQENSNVKDRMERICHEALGWDESICPTGTWCRHSFATNLRNAGVEIDYISESMGHSDSSHAITQLYIDHYPLETQMANNMKLLQLEQPKTERDTLLAQLSSLSTAQLTQLLSRSTL